MSASPARPLLTDRVRHLLHTLTFSSGVCVLLWLIRVSLTHDSRFAGYNWNLFLAWIPLWLALVLTRRIERQAWGGAFWVLATLWLLFFPNAFYIVTDLVHYKKFGTQGVPKWFDLLLTMAFASGGMFLGSMSLYLLHLAVRARYGWRRGWVFATTVLALGAFGIYLGRFARLNSWDLVGRPFKLWKEMAEVVTPPEAGEAAAFCGVFFLFSLLVYAFLVSVARLHEDVARPAGHDPTDRAD